MPPPKLAKLSEKRQLRKRGAAEAPVTDTAPPFPGREGSREPQLVKRQLEKVGELSATVAQPPGMAVPFVRVKPAAGYRTGVLRTRRHRPVCHSSRCTDWMLKAGR